jgi:hypothetical protein
MFWSVGPETTCSLLSAREYHQLWPVCTEYTLGPLLGGATSPPTNLWAIRREWLRAARSDTNPSHPMHAR